MKTDNTNLILIGLLGAGAAYFIAQSQKVTPPQQQYPYPNFQYVPIQPQPNTPEWAIWANSIISVFGNVTSLWQPGGPFYQNPNVLNQGFDININPDDFGGFV